MVDDGNPGKTSRENDDGTTLIMARRWKTTRNEPNVWLMSFILWLAANFIINLAAI